MSLKNTYTELYPLDRDYNFKEIELDRWPKNRYEAALKFITIKNTAKVLDVGCGRGDILNYIQNKTRYAYGIDISKGNIAVAKRLLNKNVKLFTQDITKKTKFPNNYFDTIILTDVIEHIPDRYSLFKELKRILKKKGKLIIETPNVVKLRNRIGFLFGKYPYTSGHKIVIKQGAPYVFDGGHIQWFTFETLRELSIQFNFKIIKQFGFGRFGKLHNICPEVLSGSIGIILENDE